MRMMDDRVEEVLKWKGCICSHASAFIINQQTRGVISNRELSP